MIGDINVDRPFRRDEVPVRTVACVVCHNDRTWQTPVGGRYQSPVLGHEAAGVIGAGWYASAENVQLRDIVRIGSPRPGPLVGSVIDHHGVARGAAVIGRLWVPERVNGY